MSHVSVLSLGLIAVVSGLVPCAGPAPGNQADDVSSPIEAWALCRFEAAGLELPPVQVRLAENPEDCRGHPGLAFIGSEEPTVVLCIASDSPPVLWKKTILHELGHVWSHANLGSDERRAFMAGRDCESWNDPETVWEHRGSEHAAEVIAWALMDRELRMITLRDRAPAVLRDAYELLTGHTPPSRNPSQCEMAVASGGA